MPERIQLRRTKGWRKPEGVFVVGRPSKWGNPFTIKEHGLNLSISLYRNLIRGVWNPALLRHLSDQRLAQIYEDHWEWKRRIDGHPLEVARFELVGRDLACWCPLSEPCHADVLLELANAEVAEHV